MRTGRRPAALPLSTRHCRLRRRKRPRMLPIQKSRIGLRQTAATTNHPIKPTRPLTLSALPAPSPAPSKVMLPRRRSAGGEHAVAKIAPGDPALQTDVIPAMLPRRQVLLRVGSRPGRAASEHARPGAPGLNAPLTEPSEQSYRNTVETNEEKASQIAIHRPSDKTITPINCASQRSPECGRVL